MKVMRRILGVLVMSAGIPGFGAQPDRTGRCVGC